MSASKRRLLTTGYEVLSRVAATIRTVSVTVRSDDTMIRYDAPAEEIRGCVADEDRYSGRTPPGMPAHWRFLSPTEEAIVKHLEEADDWLAAPDIARLMDAPCTDGFRAILKNLVDRRVLHSAPARGYKLWRQGHTATTPTD